MPGMEAIEFLPVERVNAVVGDMQLPDREIDPSTTRMIEWLKEQRQAKSRIPADYRLLTSLEIQSILPVFEAQNAALPDPTTSQIIGAVKHGRVVGFLVLQFVLHAEPVWIEPGHAEVFQGMAHAAEQLVGENASNGAKVYLMAQSGDRAIQLAQTQGFKLDPVVVMSKFVEHREPQTPVSNSDNPGMDEQYMDEPPAIAGEGEED